MLYHCTVWGEKGDGNGELAYCLQRGLTVGQERGPEELGRGAESRGAHSGRGAARWRPSEESCTDRFLCALAQRLHTVSAPAFYPQQPTRPLSQHGQVPGNCLAHQFACIITSRNKRLRSYFCNVAHENDSSEHKWHSFPSINEWKRFAF